MLLTGISQTNTATWCWQVFVRTVVLPAVNQYLSEQNCYLLLTSICQNNTATWC